MVYKARAAEERKRATMKRPDAEAIQFKGPQRETRVTIKKAGTDREENGDNKEKLDAWAKQSKDLQTKENGCRGYTDLVPVEGGGRRATIHRADVKAIQIKCP